MKKLFLLLFLVINSLLLAANVYFEYPVDGHHYKMDSGGRAGVSYHMYTVSSFFVTDWYGARVKYPDGHWGAWQTGQSGGWVFTEAGTYKIQGAVHVVYDMGGSNNYFMYSNVLTFYIDPYVPPQPLEVSISGPHSLNVHQNGTWTANASGGTPGYHYQWWYEYPAGGSYGPILPNKPVHGTWFKLGSDSKYLTRQDDEDFDLKVDVTDAHNTKVTSSVFHVLVGSDNASQNKVSVNTVQDYVLPTETKLLSNYPNPFNPTTTIKYQLKKAGLVTLKVYDILGKEVASLVNENEGTGYYKVNFDANNLSSGLYIYRLRANNYVESKKMLLTK